MTKRIAVALAALLLWVGSIAAQPSALTPSGTPPDAPPDAPPEAPAATPPGAPSAKPLKVSINLPSEPSPSALADLLPAQSSSGIPTPMAPALVAAAPTPAENNPALWVTGDAIFSWFRGVTLPPLVTTSPPGTSKTTAGILGTPGTTVLFGGPAEGSIRFGWRAAAGYWFGTDRILGVEAGYMMLGSQSSSFNASSATNPILGRPYVDALNFTNQAVLVAYPGLATGSIAVDANSGHFYTGNFDFAAKLVNNGAFQLVALAGYRFFRYDESLDISQTINPTTPVVPAGTRIVSQDSFSTTNIFNGLDLGIRPTYTWQAWSLQGLLRIGVGNLHHTVNIAGSQTITAPGTVPVIETGGVYALATNIGRHGSNDWVVFPEVGATLGWRITSNVQLRLGYGLLWLNGIARAPDQINSIVNPARFPGLTPPVGSPAQPAFYLNRTDMWIQNVNVGVMVTY